MQVACDSLDGLRLKEAVTADDPDEIYQELLQRTIRKLTS